MELSQELSVTLGKLLSGSGHCSPRCGMKGWGPRNSRVPPILKSEDNPIGIGVHPGLRMEGVGVSHLSARRWRQGNIQDPGRGLLPTHTTFPPLLLRPFLRLRPEPPATPILPLHLFPRAPSSLFPSFHKHRLHPYCGLILSFGCTQ